MADNNRRGPGRRSKGDRRLMAFRLATPRADVVRQIATAEGYEHVSDWLAKVVDERIDHTDLSIIKSNQGELPISMAS